MKTHLIVLFSFISLFAIGQTSISVGSNISAGLSHFSRNVQYAEAIPFSGTTYQLGIMSEAIFGEHIAARLSANTTRIGSSEDATFIYPDMSTVDATANGILYAASFELGGRYYFKLNSFSIAPGLGFNFTSAYQFKYEVPEIGASSNTLINDPRYNSLASYVDVVAQFPLSQDIYLNTGIMGSLGMVRFQDDLYNPPHTLQLKVEILYRIK